MQKIKIMIMDDSATARALFKAYMSSFPSYEVIETNTANGALSLAKQHKPPIIVLDYNMPELSGTQVAKLLQDEGIESLFVLLTGNTQDYIVQEAQSLGFFDIIEKPVTRDSISLLLRKLEDVDG